MFGGLRTKTDRSRYLRRIERPGVVGMAGYLSRVPAGARARVMVPQLRLSYCYITRVLRGGVGPPNFWPAAGGKKFWLPFQKLFSIFP